MRPGFLGMLLVPLAAGCVATAEYEAAVARGHSLEYELRKRDARVLQLHKRNTELLDLGSRLQLERSSLDAERVQLLQELDVLREGHEETSFQLERERVLRERREAEIAQLTGTYQTLIDELESEVASGQIEIHQLRGRLQVRALDQILFDSGSVQIKPEGSAVLEKVAGQLGRIDGHDIRVEGHTDNVPIETARFPSNWELSVARAARVVRFLIDAGLPPEGISAAGFGPHQPIALNDSPAGRARNRRIEIVLVPRPPE